jgi:hypothetical protein
MTTPRSNPVTLIDGTVVPSDSEAWRAECEARGVLRLPTKMRRLAYVRGVEEKRGFESAQKLRRDVIRVWEHQRSKEIH